MIDAPANPAAETAANLAVRLIGKLKQIGHSFTPMSYSCAGRSEVFLHRNGDYIDDKLWLRVAVLSDYSGRPAIASIRYYARSGERCRWGTPGDEFCDMAQLAGEISREIG